MTEQTTKGLFGSIVESVLTPGATQFDVGVINFAFISLILLLIVIFIVTDRAKIHVACFLALAIVTYGIIIWYLYIKEYEDDKKTEKVKTKKPVVAVGNKTKKSAAAEKKPQINKAANKNKKNKVY